MAFLSLRVSPRWKLLLALLMVSLITTYAIKRSGQIQEEMETSWEINNAKLVVLGDMRATLRAGLRALDIASGNLPAQAGLDAAKRYRDSFDQCRNQEEELQRQVKRHGTQTEVALLQKMALERQATADLVHKIEGLFNTPQAGQMVKKDLRDGPLGRWQAAIDELISAENDANTQAGSRAALAWEQLRMHVLLMGAMVVVLGLLSLWGTIKRGAAAQ